MITAPTPRQSLGDVAPLPTVAFGHRTLMWWGTVGFMVIEGWTLALLIASYFYVRQNFDRWPPYQTPHPSLLVPTINLALMVVSILPTYLADKAARRLDEPGVRRWLTVSSVVALIIPVIRWYELWALNVRWDSNAYGTAAWLVVGTHTTLLLLDVADTVGIALFYWFKRMPIKAMSDVSDNSLYWYFMVLSWIPVYLIVYLGPRFF